MRVLVACEESQRVCIAFRNKGHEAFSCDLIDCSGGHPEWHIKDDVLKHLNDGWDMMIAFPPCTDLAVSGAAHFEKKRKNGRQKRAIDFFTMLAEAPIKKIAIENPVGIMSTVYKRPSQIIQPWQFGEDASKKTCLWLKHLPLLRPTNIIKKRRYANQTEDGQNKIVVDGKWIGYNDPQTARLRSITYPGIAKAMADQWGGA